MYCRECGNQVSDNAEICMSCGVRPLNSTNYCQSCGSTTNSNQEICTNCGVRLIKRKSGSSSSVDNPSTLLNLVVCCFPIVGIILYFVWKEEKPLSAKSVCKWAIIGFVLSTALYIIGMVLGAFSEALSY